MIVPVKSNLDDGTVVRTVDEGTWRKISPPPTYQATDLPKPLLFSL